MKLSVVSPTFNEANNIGPLVEAVCRALQGVDYEILVVDDDSPDLTWQRAEVIRKTNPRVRVLRRTRNPGLAASVVEGFSKARGEVLACIDADLQHDPSILPKMLAEIEKGSNVVVGSRYTPGGGTGDWNTFRRFGSRMATKLAQLFLRTKLRDPMSGYFLIRREDFLAVKENVNAEGFKILLEIIAKLRPRVVTEVPYVFRPRNAGDSKLSNKVVFLYFKQVWRLCGVDSIVSLRFAKFGLVGITGIAVNLVSMALIINFVGWRDWRASALATFVAIFNNYVLNNAWTFRDRVRRRASFFRGYVLFLLLSQVGLAVTTASYTALTMALGILLGHVEPTVFLPTWTLLSCQFVAIFFGAYFNYTFNALVTWSASVNKR